MVQRYQVTCLETMSGEIRAAAETSGPFFSGLTTPNESKTDLLTSSPPMEQDNANATMDITNDEMDAKLDNNLPNLRTDTRDPTMPPTAQNDKKTVEKDLPEGRAQHLTDADLDFWSSVLTNGTILSTFLHFAPIPCLSCTSGLSFHHIHNSGIAICHTNPQHRFNRESFIHFLSTQDTSLLQQQFLDCPQYLAIQDHYESTLIPVDQITMGECDFVSSHISTTKYPIHLPVKTTYEETTTTLTIQKYAFQTTTAASIIKSKMTDRLNKIGYCRRIYPARDSSNRIYTFICIYPTKDDSFKEEMEKIIHNFVDLNKFEGTQLVIYDEYESCLDAITIPTNNHSTEERNKIIDATGYDDTLVDYISMVNLLLDISRKAGNKYAQDTYFLRGKLFTKLKLAHSNTTINRTTMMYVPVHYIKLGTSDKIEEICAVKSNSLVQDNDFYYKHWHTNDVIEVNTNDVIEVNIIRDQKVMEKHLKTVHSHLSTTEFNSFIQKWRIAQIKSSKASKNAIQPGKIQIPSSDVIKSPLLNGDMIIVIQKSVALAGRKHYITVPVNPFDNYPTSPFNALDLYLLHNDISLDEIQSSIPIKRHQSTSTDEKISNKKTKEDSLTFPLITMQNEESTSSNVTFISFLGKTIITIDIYSYQSFQSLESFTTTLCKLTDCYYIFNNRLLTEQNYHNTINSSKQQKNNILTIKAKLNGGSSSDSYNLRSYVPLDQLTTAKDIKKADPTFKPDNLSSSTASSPISSHVVIPSPIPSFNDDYQDFYFPDSSMVMDSSELTETYQSEITMSYVTQWDSGYPVKLALDYTKTLTKRLPTPLLQYIPLRLDYHGYQYIIRVPKSDISVFNIKIMLAGFLEIPSHLFQILYNNEVLEDQYTIDQYRLQNFSIITVVQDASISILQPSLIYLNHLAITFNGSTSLFNIDMSLDHQELAYFIREVVQLEIIDFQFTVNGKTCLPGKLHSNYDQVEHVVVIVTPKLLGGAKRMKKVPAIVFPTPNMTPIPSTGYSYLPTHLVAIKILVDQLPTVFQLRFERSANIKSLINYFQSQYLLKGTITSLELENTLPPKTPLPSVSHLTLKFLSLTKIKKPKTLLIDHKGIVTKFPIPSSYNVAVILKRLNDLYNCTGELYASGNPKQLQHDQNIYTHPSIHFFYIPHGYTFIPQQSIGSTLLPTKPITLQATNSKVFNISCLNCHGLKSSLPGIRDYLENSNTNVMVLLETAKGHSNDKLNEYVDYLTWFKHKYKPTSLKVKGTIFNRTRKPNDVSHYRLYDVVKGIKEKSLNVKKFKKQLHLLKNKLLNVRNNKVDMSNESSGG